MVTELKFFSCWWVLIWQIGGYVSLSMCINKKNTKFDKITSYCIAGYFHGVNNLWINSKKVPTIQIKKKFKNPKNTKLKPKENHDSKTVNTVPGRFQLPYSLPGPVFLPWKLWGAICIIIDTTNTHGCETGCTLYINLFIWMMSWLLFLCAFRIGMLINSNGCQ